jgi:uncharacterized protein (TIGR03437 family)
MKWAGWILPWLAIPMAAQGVISAVRVEAVPTGAPFVVDGQIYRSPQTFLWASGTRHVLDVPPDPQEKLNPTEYEFAGWEESTATLEMAGRRVEIVASPALTHFRAIFRRYHQVRFDFEPGAGSVFIGASTVTGPRSLYFIEGTEVLMRATPSPGWVFAGWDPNSHPGTEPALRFRVLRPMRFHPVFTSSRRVTIVTDPPGREVYVERTRVATPYTTDWANRATYTLGAPSPQRDANGLVWIFDRWSYGGGNNSTYTVDQAGDFTLTGYFTRGGTIAFFTAPPGLRLNIDGRDNHLSYEFQWAMYSRHTVEAPAEQTDAAGRRWTFSHWAHGGPRVQTYVMLPGDADQGRVTWAAHYRRLPRLTIEAPPEVTIELDGAPCARPCVADRAEGSAIQLRAPAAVEISPETRLEFVRWSNGLAAAATVSLSGDVTLRAEYRRTHRVSVTALPADAATFALDPGEFVAEGQLVTVRALPSPGFRLRQWQGDAWGTANPTSFGVEAPRSVRAVFDRVPYVDPLGVRNAAGDTPDSVVAPGSRVAIRGLHLAAETAIASGGVTQTLGEVTITWRGRFVPLVAVSPELIQAVLPWIMPEGEQELEIQRPGQPPVKALAQVARNAPGLFDNVIHGPDHRVTLLATGLGPFSPTPLDGLAIPPSFGAVPLDPVEVEVDGVPVPHENLRLAAGLPGIASLEIRLPAGARRIRLLANGRASNTIELPSNKGDHVNLDQ